MSNEIGPVRPMFNLEDRPPGKNVERLITGTKWHGMMIDVTSEGLEINGYYTGMRENKHYSILREPVIIPWAELEKLRARSKHEKQKTANLDRVESEVDEEYLTTLPKVTINGKQYYIDPQKRERRSVERPAEVWRF